MTTDNIRLSAPVYHRRPPRDLTDGELTGLLRIADVLIPQSGEMPPASRAPEFEHWLSRALAARADAFEGVAAEGARFADIQSDALENEVRALARERPELFQPLSAVLAGAYLMIPQIRSAIGYPGQQRNHPRFDEAAEEIMDGILDPVIERGSIYTAVDTVS
jgi:hypothetical protein